MTSLWDLGNGEIVGKYESYVRGSDDAEPCMFSFPTANEEKSLNSMLSLVNISPPKQ